MAGRPGDAAMSYVNIARAKQFKEIRSKTRHRIQVWTLKEDNTFVGYATTEISDRIPDVLHVMEIYLEPRIRGRKDIWAFFVKNIREVATKLGKKRVAYSPLTR